MSVWSQIVASYETQPKIKAKEQLPPNEKRCTGCGLVKPKSEYYAKKSHSPNAISSRCKPCYIKQQSDRYKEYKI